MCTVHNKYHKTAGPDAVYIGRGSKWGNPYVIGKDGDRDQVCDLFEQNVLPTLDLSELEGKDLVCFCAPQRCHGDAILKAANKPKAEQMENTTVNTQADLELLFSKHQLLDVLVEQFSEISDDEFTQNAMAQIYLHKQADVPTMVGVLSPKWGEPQEVADMLLQICEDDLMTYDVEAMRFIMEYEISLDVQEMLDRYQYPLPSITKPIPIGENKGSQTNTGYQTIKASPILNGSNVFNGMDLCLEHLDRANSVALELNLGVMTSDQGKPMPVVRKKDEEFTDFKKRKRQHDIFYSATADVMDTLLALSDEIYLTHKFDRRGRTYSCGYHVNTQGTDFNKAVLGLKKKELVT